MVNLFDPRLTAGLAGLAELRPRRITPFWLPQHPEVAGQEPLPVSEDAE